jgi:hypothetical protein
MERIMVVVAQLSVIERHDYLHGGLLRRGMGTATMEVKLNSSLRGLNRSSCTRYIWISRLPMTP